MKCSSLIILYIAYTMSVNAQIPNSGFENWTNFGNYEDPTYWGSTNSYSTGSFYAVTKSTDHYPESVGSYSVRLENNTAMNPNYGARGGLFTGPPPPSPDFELPPFWPYGNSSLTGYYKFAPQNGDTMLIRLQLFRFGLSVFSGDISTTTPAPNWTSFNIPIPSFLLADSGSIILAAYNADGFTYMPHGNSVLYVDNLNFDELITGVAEPETERLFSLYPNPASQSIVISHQSIVNGMCELNIYNATGQLVYSAILCNNKQQVDLSNLSSGVYTAELHTSSEIQKQKLIIQH